MSLPAFATRHPVTIAMATLAVVLLGWISVDRLGVDLLPDLQTRAITIDIRSAGKTPQEMEERYARRVEAGVSTVSSVKRVHSVSRSGQAVVVAQFEWDADMDFALLDVQKKTAVYAADTEVSSLDVLQEDPRSLPVMRIAVTASPALDLDDLVGTVETAVKPKLESLAGVASAEVEGGATKEVRVVLDPYLLEAFGVTAETVASRIRSANLDVSGGTLKEGGKSYLVKGLGRLKDVADVESLIVGERRGTTAGGAPDADALRVPVVVRDVGSVELRYEEREHLVRLDGPECVGLAIYKEAGANTVDVVRAANQELGRLKEDLPDLRFSLVENQADFIERSVSEVEEAALYGALLAIGVLVLVLRNWTATLVIGMAIPISVLATFTLMYFEGLTLNIMTLGGLALGAGMLVDNAIVVIENIYRHLEKGESPIAASAKGASEVGVAILASTLTTVSVFLPIVYIEGLAGELFKEQAWTVTFSLVSSLAVAMATVPMLASRMLKKGKARARKAKSDRYARILASAMERPAHVVLIALASLAVALLLVRSIRTEFIPREDQGTVAVELSMPEGTRLEVTDRVGMRVSEIIREIAGDAVRHIYSRVGTDPSRVFAAGEPTGPNRATLSVLLANDRRLSAGQIVALVDGPLAEIPQLSASYRLNETAVEGLIGSDNAPIQVEISGDNLEVLSSLTKQLREGIASLSSVYNVRTSFQGGQPEVNLVLREQVLAGFGFTTQSFARQVEGRLSGEVAGELSRDQRIRNIRVGYQDVDMDELRGIRIDAPDGTILTLGDLADLEIVAGPREILRDGQKRVGRISAYLPEGIALSQAVEDIHRAVDAFDLPRGYRAKVTGEEQQRSESFGSLAFALGLSVILVYMVMAALFESLVHPFTVMLSVPLAGIGVVLAFWMLGLPFSVMAFIGMIMLGGIAVNDAIILVDRINQLRRELPDLRTAVLHAAQDRLRPILMTTATTILALLPMAVGVGEGARMRAPMAIAVIGGLVTSTLMTLIVIPVAYRAVDRLRRRPPS
jgi:hydrophobic/amphiphilic exporter-1 (mainly G- bacteria), HAE1 family